MNWINSKDQLPNTKDFPILVYDEVGGIGIVNTISTMSSSGESYILKGYCACCRSCKKPYIVNYWMPLIHPPCPLYDPPNNCNCHLRARDKDEE